MFTNEEAKIPTGMSLLRTPDAGSRIWNSRLAGFKPLELNDESTLCPSELDLKEANDPNFILSISSPSSIY